MIDAELARENRRVLLVDGFNVLHAVLLKSEREAGWWKRKQRERLLRLACEWPIADDEIWVAFDGAQPAWSVWAEPVAKVLQTQGPGDQDQGSGQGRGHRRATIHSVYVESADDWIVRRARRTPHPERTIVVSADRQVTGRARSAGCEVWTPWSFMSQLPSREDQSPDVSPEDETATPNRAV